MPLTFETLESRLLMAAKIRDNDTTVFIKGDNTDADIEVLGTGDAGSFEVYLDGTLVGEFHGINKLKIKTGGGEFNSVYVDGVILTEGIQIDGGNGDEDITVVDCNVETLKINTKGGDDIVAVSDNIIHYHVDVNTGGGDDDVMLDGNEFKDDVKVNLGGGDDILAIDTNIFIKYLTVKAGGGDDDVDISGNTHNNDVKADGGGGEDTLTSDGPAILGDSKKFETLA